MNFIWLLGAGILIGATSCFSATNCLEPSLDDGGYAASIAQGETSATLDEVKGRGGRETVGELTCAKITNRSMVNKEAYLRCTDPNVMDGGYELILEKGKEGTVAIVNKLGFGTSKQVAKLICPKK